MAERSQQQLFRHGGLYAASTLGSAALSLLILPVYVSVLGKRGLGQVDVLQAGTSALTLTIAQGLPAAFFRMRFEYQEAERRAFESIVSAYIVLSGLAAVALGLLLGPWLARWLTPEIDFYPLWLLSIAIAATNVLGDVYATGLQAEARSGQFVVFTLGRRALMLGLIVLLVVQARWGVLGKVAGEALAATTIALCVLFWLRPHWSRLQLREARPLLRAALAYGWPLLPHALAMQVVAVSDRFVLNHYLGLSAVGVYALGYRIASVLESVTGGLANAYRALFMASAADASQDRAQQDARLADLELKLLAAVSFGAHALSIATRDVLALVHIDLLAFAEAWQVSYIVCWGLLAHAAYAVLAAPLFYAQHATSRVAGISMAAAAVNLVGCLLFVPRVGLHAAAWATAASHICLAAGAYVLGRRVWTLPRSLPSWSMLFAWHSLVLALGWQVDVHLDTWPQRIAAKAVLVLLSALVCTRTLFRKN